MVPAANGDRFVTRLKSIPEADVGIVGEGFFDPVFELHFFHIGEIGVGAVADTHDSEKGEVRRDAGARRRERQLFYQAATAADIQLSLAGRIFVIIKKTIMTTQEIAARYYELASQRKVIEIQDSLYDENVVCQEPEKAAAMGFAVITTGREAIKAKGVARRATIEAIHSYSCSEPIVAGDFFSVVLKQDITFIGRPRVTLEEIAIFQVKDGKVIKEQFFY